MRADATARGHHAAPRQPTDARDAPSRRDRPGMKRPVIALDWGTSSLRAYRMDANGAIAERRALPLGIMAVTDNAFEAAFESAVGDWLNAAADAVVVLSGMIGSRQGWREAPYLACPADVSGLAGAVVARPLARGGTAWIAPGLSTRNAGVPDVMRGEEVQILGASGLIGGGACSVCLPGSHSKWARVDGARVTGFATHFTGECFDALRKHTILGRMIDHAAWDDAAFLAGLDRAADGGGLLHHLFGVRAAGLFGELSDTAAGAFLSGLTIGHELNAALADAPDPLLLVGSAELTALYATALAHRGRAARSLEPDVAARGLYLLACSIAERGPA
jgi:2-dehydro-3-deoxygalactonokinase